MAGRISWVVVLLAAGCGRLDFDPLTTISRGTLSLGFAFTCALRPSGTMVCWGSGANGHLGYGNTLDIGDDEAPALAGNVPLGTLALQLDSGAEHTCARVAGDSVRCWGQGASGKLGYGNVATIGDDEGAGAAGDVQLGAAVAEVAVGGLHSCARLGTGSVRCWGSGAGGRLGTGNLTTIGDDETPASAADVTLGGVAVEIVARGAHTCVRLDAGQVRCWGDGSLGQLGYGNPNNIGDDETVASAGDVDVGGMVVELAAGASHTCARLATGAVRCWGNGADGRLGYASTASIGDDETPASAGDVPLGGHAVRITAGANHTCALLENGAVRCWGLGASGQLGYGNPNSIGDDETPASAGDVVLGAAAVDIEAGGDHTCARMTTGAIRCWGNGASGQLGYANTNTIGDDETPASAGDVPLD